MTSLDLPAGNQTGAGRDHAPVTGSPPVSRRAASVTPGGPAITDPRGMAGGTTSPQRHGRMAAGMPDPETGADGLPSPASARGRASSPAGGALPPRAGGADAPPAGSKTYTIVLPAGMELLNANDRDSHWARRRRITGELRETAGWAARAERIPALQRAYILGVYEPPNRRRRDPANLYPSFKACVDGLVDAGVLLDDDAAHLDGPDMRLGDICPRGRLVLHITEVAAATGGAA